MLHSMFTISSTLEFQLTPNNSYKIFDSRDFQSDHPLEETFQMIKESFLYLYDYKIAPFIRSVISNEGTYSKTNSKVGFTLEEAIELKSLSLDTAEVDECLVDNYSVRLFSFTHCEKSDLNNAPYAIFHRRVYNTFENRYKKVISIFINKDCLRSIEDKEFLNTVLTNIMMYSAITYLDLRLNADYQVPINNLEQSFYNYESIILHEDVTSSDAYFIYAYFRTIFELFYSISSNHSIRDTSDLANLSINLPEMFYDDSTYNKILEIAYNRVLKRKEESNEEVVDMCYTILNTLVPNVVIGVENEEEE